MPITVQAKVDPITGRLKPLSDDQIAKVKQEFISDAERELKILGAHSPEAVKLLLAMRDGDMGRLEVKPGALACSVWFWAPRTNGGLNTAQKAADWVAEEMARRARSTAFGPDPEQVLIRRLVDVGVPKDEARALAANRIERLDDGRVRARKRNGETLFAFGEVTPRNADGSRREFTSEELAALRDHNKPVTELTRAILAEREADARQQAEYKEAARIEAENDAAEAARIIEERKLARDPSAIAAKQMRSNISAAF